MNSSMLAFCVSVFLSVLGKSVLFPASESNGFMKKKLDTVQSLVLEMSLVNGVCTMLL